jgi:hypothetical protein
MFDQLSAEILASLIKGFPTTTTTTTTRTRTTTTKQNVDPAVHFVYSRVKTNTHYVPECIIIITLKRFIEKFFERTRRRKIAKQFSDGAGGSEFIILRMHLYDDRKLTIWPQKITPP